VAGAWGAGSGAHKSGESGEKQKNGWDSQIGRLCSSAVIFLGDLMWPRDIRTHLIFLGLVHLVDEHKSLCSSGI
jgi:hypothetical protein